jgi:zinc D-Ala-D-Ala carboxypeptidase
MNFPLWLSPHFTLAELIASETAARRGIDNDPSPEVVERLKHTCVGLEAIRTRLGAPLHITSGYRSLELNRAVGSSDTSDHVTGDAADFICPRFGGPVAIVGALRDAEIPFDQLIEEFGRWVHVSFAPRMRGQVLRIDASGTRSW